MAKQRNNYLYFITLLFSLSFYTQTSLARDLSEIKADGILRHVGVPYANFITLYQEGDTFIEGGLDVELMQGFAEYLGVKYKFIPATWSTAFTLLTGQSAHYIDNQLVRGKSKHSIQGDVLANGATILPWRKQVVDFSDDYFPSAVWLVARSDSDLTPIKPGTTIVEDIDNVKAMLKDRKVLAMKQTCLDPDLYNLHLTQANIILPTKELQLNEMVPAILNNDAEATLLDVADSLIALQKWSGEIKVIGPISKNQRMGVAFRKNSSELRNAFNQYLQKLQRSGKYNKLVKKYYPSVFDFYADFFQ